MFVNMDLPELAITGPAYILDIVERPEVNPGNGQVVTAFFRHSSADVIDLTISSGDNDKESIGTPTNHPFWSVDRKEYVQAGSLNLGERLQTFSGDTKRVIGKLPRPGPEAVYNFEVHGEHVYYVGSDGILVHNAGDDYFRGEEFLVKKLTVREGAGRLLRTALKKLELNGDQAHHLIPIAVLRDLSEESTAFAELLELAARAGFDANGAKNGKFLSNLRHPGSHPKYSTYVE